MSDEVMTQNEFDRIPNPFQRIIAKAMGQMSEDDVSQMIALAVEKQLQEYDCKRIIEAVVNSTLRKLIVKLVEEPEVIDILTTRARQQLQQFANSALLKSPNPGGY